MREGKNEQTTLAIGRNEIEPPNTLLALGLAILVGAAVFVFIWKIRKTFGMKE